MTLVELVRLLNNARDLNTGAAIDQTLKTFASINATIEPWLFSQDNQEVQQKIVDLLKSVDNDIADICKKLEDQINIFTERCYRKSEEIYNNSVRYDTPEYLLDKNLQYFNSAPDDSKQIFLERIKAKVDWRFPGLEIRPNNAFISEHMVACDPLYLVDTRGEMFARIRELWNSLYQRRVRYYTIDETSEEILGALPANQFGLIVSADFFDHRPMSVIEKYLVEFYRKLRPGGTAIFTFNDCDYPEGVENFDNIYYCYTPGHTIIEYCKAMGYIVKDRMRLNGASSYLEIQKPGTLETIRAAQTLGKIIEI